MAELRKATSVELESAILEIIHPRGIWPVPVVIEALAHRHGLKAGASRVKQALLALLAAGKLEKQPQGYCIPGWFDAYKRRLVKLQARIYGALDADRMRWKCLAAVAAHHASGAVGSCTLPDIQKAVARGTKTSEADVLQGLEELLADNSLLGNADSILGEPVTGYVVGAPPDVNWPATALQLFLVLERLLFQCSANDDSDYARALVRHLKPARAAIAAATEALDVC